VDSHIRDARATLLAGDVNGGSETIGPKLLEIIVAEGGILKVPYFELEV
jgi:hypothetical protein